MYELYWLKFYISSFGHVDLYSYIFLPKGILSMYEYACTICTVDDYIGYVHTFTCGYANMALVAITQT